MITGILPQKRKDLDVFLVPFSLSCKNKDIFYSFISFLFLCHSCESRNPGLFQRNLFPRMRVAGEQGNKKCHSCESRNDKRKAGMTRRRMLTAQLYVFMFFFYFLRDDPFFFLFSGNIVSKES